MSLTNEEIIKQQEIAEQLLKNKLLSSTNFLDYTKLTYEDIITAINSKISSDRRFDNFRESAAAQTILEIFAGCTDLVNYNIERIAEECYLDTAKLKSSLILLARNLAYDIKRSIPAQCRMKIILKGNISSSTYSVGDIIQIPQYTNFSIESNNFLLMKQFNYTLTSDDLDKGSDFKKEIYYNQVTNNEDSNIKLLQGERKTVKISGLLNANVNQVFQKFLISDKTFSNLYGDKDLTSPLTEVGIGTDINTAFPNGVSEWTIDRRTLLRSDSIENYDFLSDVQTAKKICLIRTSMDEGVEILFGDDKYVSKGLKNVTDNLFIRYLSTLGSSVNKTGMITKKPSLLDTVTLRGTDLNSNLEFELISNISMGSDIESNEAIKVNAPAIFYSLDRLVTKDDYIGFLESLSSPIVVKNAISWGEQEEIRLGKLYNESNRSAIKKLFNVILFSVVGSLYNTSSNLTEFSTKDNLSEENAVLDSDYKEDEINSQSYFNLFTINDDNGGNIVEEIQNQTIVSKGSNKTNTYIVINGGKNENDINDWKNYKPVLDVIKVYYTSADNITDKNSTEVSYFDLTLNSTNYNSFDDIATWMTNEIKSKNIFPNDLLCEYDSTNNMFIMKHLLVSGGNYIVDIYDYNTNTDSYDETLKLDRNLASYNKITYIDQNISYSENISEVINLLEKRSQITIKNVYVSPIIQTFDLVGNIYVNNLINKDTIKTKIYNKIYSWLDDNIDFNSEIILSNFIELIESFPTVKRTDIKLQPHSNLRSDNQYWFNSGLNYDNSINYNLDNESKNRSVYWKALTIYGSENAYIIAKIFNEEVQNFLNNYLGNSSNFYLENFSNYLWGVNVINNTENFNNIITERFFFNKFAKPIYERLKNELSIDYCYSSIFREDISNLHKDLSYIIKNNMIDSSGNISQEFETILVVNKELKKLIRGGYSLGNEIVKVKLNLQVIYK